MANLFVKLLLCTIYQKFSYSLKKIFFKFLFVFVFGYAAVHRLSLVAARRAIFSLQCMGFSLGWLLLLQSIDNRLVGFSNCSTQALEHGLSSCGAWA